jgi:methionyl aminopeptidase
VIVCRSQSEIEKLRRVNQLVGRILAELKAMAAPGVTTLEIDAAAEARVRDAGAEPAFKGYHGYPATVCASVNDQVVHGIPSARKLVEGDILSIDMGAKLDGYFGDCAVTVAISVPAEADTLLKVTEEALFGHDGRPGAVTDIGAAVRRVEAVGFGGRESSGTASERRSTGIAGANYGPGGRGHDSRRMVFAIDRW